MFAAWKILLQGPTRGIHSAVQCACVSVTQKHTHNKHQRLVETIPLSTNVSCSFSTFPRLLCMRWTWQLTRGALKCYATRFGTCAGRMGCQLGCFQWLRCITLQKMCLVHLDVENRATLWYVNDVFRVPHFDAPEMSKKLFLSIQDIIPPASIKQAATDGVTDGPLLPSLSSPLIRPWRWRPKQSAGEGPRFCRVKGIAKAKWIWHKVSRVVEKPEWFWLELRFG